jgi:hypothetical protein
MDDGSQQNFSKNGVKLLPPGHDAWSVGNEPCVLVEFSRGNGYYTGEHGRWKLDQLQRLLLKHCCVWSDLGADIEMLSPMSDRRTFRLLNTCNWADSIERLKHYEWRPRLIRQPYCRINNLLNKLSYEIWLARLVSIIASWPSERPHRASITAGHLWYWEQNHEHRRW